MEYRLAELKEKKSFSIKEKSLMLSAALAEIPISVDSKAVIVYFVNLTMVLP